LVIRVQTRDGEPVEKALRRLRKLCNNEGITRKSKAKSYFEKPSERRRREARERAKSIRLATRSRNSELQKLLNRRRKQRKNARAALREQQSSESKEASRSDEAKGSEPPREATRSEAPAKPQAETEQRSAAEAPGGKPEPAARD